MCGHIDNLLYYRQNTLYTGPNPPSPILFATSKLFVATLISLKGNTPVRRSKPFSSVNWGRRNIRDTLQWLIIMFALCLVQACYFVLSKKVTSLKGPITRYTNQGTHSNFKSLHKFHFFTFYKSVFYQNVWLIIMIIKVIPL